MARARPPASGPGGSNTAALDLCISLEGRKDPGGIELRRLLMINGSRFDLLDDNKREPVPCRREFDSRLIGKLDDDSVDPLSKAGELAEHG